MPITSGAPKTANGRLNIRGLSRQRVLEIVRRSGPVSRADLAKATRLSPPTVSAVVDDLLREPGLMREIGIGESSGGRPPVLLEFNDEFGYLIGADVGSRTLRVALADLQGRIIARRREPTNRKGGHAIIEQLCTLAGDLFDTSGRDRRRLSGVGIGAPGMTDVTAGRVIDAVNLPGWVDLPLRDIVEPRLGAPVAVDNDANMAALGERWKGSATEVRDFVFLAIGAGVGAGLVVGGQLHRGHHWYAGEVGHMNLDVTRTPPAADGRGYLERHVGADAISAWPQVQLILGKGGDRAGAVARIIAAARAGDARAHAVLEDVAVYLGTAVANIAAVLDPALVVFGGGLSQAGDLLLEPVRRAVARIAPRVPALRVSELGEDAQLMGALFTAMTVADTRLAQWLGGASFPTPAARRGNHR